MLTALVAFHGGNQTVTALAGPSTVPEEEGTTGRHVHRVDMQDEDGTESRVIRCLTPYLITGGGLPDSGSAGLEPGDDAHREQGIPGQTLSASPILADTDEVQEYESESGRFRLLYTTEGPDSVWTQETGIGEPGVPDYIILAAQYADSSYRYQVEQLGYTDPLNSSRCGSGQEAIGPRIDIRFGDLRSNGNEKLYGYFDPQTPSVLYVNSTFFDPDFLRNDDEDDRIYGIPGILGALKVTIAHELKHAIQYATNCFSGNEINIHWVEMDATMMENVVYPDVNDYYNYIGGTAGIFGNPQTRFPRAYSHVTFMLYYHEEFGKDFWVDVWEEIGAEYLAGRDIPMLEAMDGVIGERRSGDNAELPDLELSLLRNYLWHLASGERSLFAYGFSERLNYPDAQVSGSFDVIPEWPGEPVTVPYHSARFFEFRADEMDAAGDVALALFNSDLPLGIGLLGKTYNGNVIEYLLHAKEEKRQKIAFPVDWENLDWLGVVAMNTRGGSPVNRMQLLTGEGPSIERYHYGNISRSGILSLSDAEWMLSQTMNPLPLSVFDIFLGDVSGDGSISPYDAARVLMNLNSGTDFPVDGNGDGMGPEWSRFVMVDADEDPPARVSAASLASPSAKNSATVIVSATKPDFKPVFVPVTKQRTEVGSDPSTASDTLFDGPDDLPDTLVFSLHLLGDQVLAEQKMELLLEIQDGSEGAAQPDVPWHALYLDLEIDFPPEDGGTQPGDPISLEMVDLLPGNGESALRLWDSENPSQRLRVALASSAPLVSEEHPSRLSILQLIPQNEGLIHFRVAGLQLDEQDYAVAHTPMDTIRVMGPVFAEEPDEPDPEIPTRMVLEQNYPNPFNPETVIGFTLPEAGQVSLHIYDITGRRVAKLVDGHMEQGWHRIRFDMRNQADLSSGVYLYRLSSNGQVLTRKMTLVK